MNLFSVPLNSCWYNAQRKIALHYSIEVDPKRTKESIKGIIVANLQEGGVLTNKEVRSEVDAMACFHNRENCCYRKWNMKRITKN